MTRTVLGLLLVAATGVGADSKARVMDCECSVRPFNTFKVNVQCISVPGTTGSTCKEDIVPRISRKYQYFEDVGLYALYRIGRGWHDAVSVCKADGGHLAVPETVAEMKVLLKVMQKDPGVDSVWVGYTDAGRDGDYKSVTGKRMEEAEFKSWARGEPDNPKGDKDCAVLRDDGRFVAYPCTWGRAFVCEKHLKATVPPGYNFHQGVGFLRGRSQRKKYLEARDVCWSEGGILVVPDSEETTEAILREIGHYTEGPEDIWLGFNDLKTEGVFVTETGKPFNKIAFMGWDPTDGNNDEDCGTIHTVGGFSDRNCDDPLRFVCELQDAERLAEFTCGNRLPSVTNDEFLCGSGKCIDKTLVCNGKKDCSDGTDEASQTCQSEVCPKGKFKCKSGACIDASGRCDGKVQCEEDFSDEDPASCPQCVLPKKPENGGYTIGTCKSPNCGPHLAQHTSVDFFCDPGYLLLGNKEAFCSNGQWSSPPPNCLVCGRRHTNLATPVVEGRRFAQKGEFPWHVGIYQLYTNHYSLICGGSIISPRYVLTAAQCIYNETSVTAKDEKNYKIVAGSVYKDFYINKSDRQIRNIEKIFIKPEYRGQYRSYDSDISVLLVDKQFIFNSVVQPVCIDWSRSSDFSSQGSGVVTGWCFTENNSSSGDLSTGRLPLVNTESCFSRVPNTFQRFLTIDKFCADNGDGKGKCEHAVCRGSSGAGMFFEQTITSGPVFFIHGIVSVAPISGEKECPVNNIVLFTKIRSYLDWLKSYA